MDNSPKNQILATVKSLGKASVSDIVNELPSKKSRQWISFLLKQLVQNKELVRSKEGKFAFFVLPERLDLIAKKTSVKLPNINLHEDVIFEELSNNAPFIRGLNENVNSILRYACTEMINNVIDHSQANIIEVFIEEINEKIVFEVYDNGIGVFKNIMKKKKLNSEIEAIQELLKGKTTTLPHSHSGEGIFFTSKIADVFVLDSFEYRLRVDNTLPDVFIESIDSVKGTRVRFAINKNSKKHLSGVFTEYEAEHGSYAFDKTRVHVKLFKAGTEYISRSQAKRLLANLDKFKLIVLDFKDIKTVGQAFADEIFRVFSSKHPDINIEPINMINTVGFMVKRVQKP